MAPGGPQSLPFTVRVLRHLGGAGQGRGTGAMRAWVLWEAIWVPRSRVLRPGGLIRYALGTHHARALVLRDGTIVRRGDRLVELHLDNRTLLRLAGGGFDAFGAELLGSGELRDLAALVARGELGPVKALHAITPFGPALRRRGFEIRPVRHTIGNALTRFYLSGLLALYHPRGWAGLTPQRARRWPSEAWMSLERFLARDPARPDRP